MRPVTLTPRAADVELEPGIYTHYDFALHCPLLRTATRKVGAVYVVFLASTTSATSLEWSCLGCCEWQLSAVEF